MGGRDQNDVRDIGWGSVEWIQVAQDSDGLCEYGDEPSELCYTKHLTAVSTHP
jgi:hypothetical protein